MSIVQDALKKAENKQSKTESAEGGRKNIGPVILMITLLALIVFAVRIGIGSFGKTDSAYGISIAEAMMKPMSQAASNRDETSQNKSARMPERKSFPGQKFPDFILNGIMHLVDGPRAIINNVVVGTGDVISGAKVIKIEKDKVVLSSRGRDVTLGLN